MSKRVRTQTRYVLLAVVLLLALSTFTVAFAVTVFDVTYDHPDCYTWVYTIDATSASHGISHMTLEMGVCVNGHIVSVTVVDETGATISGSLETPPIQKDGSLPGDPVGLKWTPDGGIDMKGHTYTMTIVLDTCFEPESNDFWVKAGGIEEFFEVLSPSCIEFEIPEIPFGTIMALIPTLVALVLFIKRPKIKL